MTTIALVGDSHMSALAPRVRPALEAAGFIVIRAVANPGKSTGWYVSSGALHQATLGVDLAVVELGGNDLQGDRSKAAYETLLRNARAQIAAPKVLWVGPSYATDAADADAGDRHELAARYQAQIIPRLRGSARLDSRRATDSNHRDDGVHFDDKGYDAWSSAILEGVAWLRTPPVVRAASLLGAFGPFGAFRRL
jgi:lysophospholipase L1-like esterase